MCNNTCGRLSYTAALELLAHTLTPSLYNHLHAILPAALESLCKADCVRRLWLGLGLGLWLWLWLGLWLGLGLGLGLRSGFDVRV